MRGSEETSGSLPRELCSFDWPEQECKNVLSSLQWFIYCEGFLGDSGQNRWSRRNWPGLDGAASNAFKGSVEANLSLVFTTIVDMVESMNSGQLYPLISRLRKMELPEQPVIDVEPLEKAEEFLSEGLQQQEDEWGI